MLGSFLRIIFLCILHQMVLIQLPVLQNFGDNLSVSVRLYRLNNITICTIFRARLMSFSELEVEKITTGIRDKPLTVFYLSQDLVTVIL